MVSGTTSVTVKFQVMVFCGFHFNVATYTHPDHDKVIIICTPPYTWIMKQALRVATQYVLRPLQFDNIFVFIRQVAPVPDMLAI